MKRIILFLILFPGFLLALSCSNCGKTIQGKYYKASDGQLFCADCYSTIGRCDMCGKPSANILSGGGKKLCPSCYNSVPRCESCGEIILGKAYKFEGDSRLFCEKCRDSKDMCDLCGVPLAGGQGYVIEAKRKICEKCKESSIIDPAEAERIYGEILTAAEKEYNIKLNKAVPIKMVSREEMKKEAKGRIENADRLFGLYTGNKDKGAIYFLFGTPRYIMRATLAHEFAHAWQEENCVKGQSKDISEGFAEWFAMKILVYFNDTVAAEALEKNNNYYREGLMYYKNLEEKSNTRSVIQHAKYIKQIPFKASTKK